MIWQINGTIRWLRYSLQWRQIMLIHCPPKTKDKAVIQLMAEKTGDIQADCQPEEGLCMCPWWMRWLWMKQPEGEQGRRWTQSCSLISTKRLQAEQVFQMLGQGFQFTWEHWAKPSAQLRSVGPSRAGRSVAERSGSSGRRERTARPAAEPMRTVATSVQVLIPEGFQDWKGGRGCGRAG